MRISVLWLYSNNILKIHIGLPWTLYIRVVYKYSHTCVEKNTQPTDSHGAANAVNTHAILKRAIMHYKGKGKMIPLQARCGPEGG